MGLVTGENFWALSEITDPMFTNSSYVLGDIRATSYGAGQGNGQVIECVIGTGLQKS